MSRLTEKVKDMDIYIKLPTKEKQAFLDKLGQYEDLGEVDDLKADKQVLDVIIKKNVDMLLIKKYDNASDYNSAVWLSGRDKLTDDEFNTLKESVGE